MTHSDCAPADISCAPANRGLRYYSKFVVYYALFVIFAGAMVTSHDAGLSVPDWPTTYGENMFLFPYYKWVDGIFYEHSHRLVAFGVGSLTLVLAIWVACVERRRWMRVLAGAALGTVVLQALLGGLTVRFKLPDVLSIAHGVVAQTYLVLTVVIAYGYSAELQRRRDGEAAATHFKLALACAIAVYVQLIIGALMRHTGSGLALTDFPRMAGSFWPVFDAAMLDRVNEARQAHGWAPIGLFNIGVHVLHRLWGFVVSALLIFAAWRVKNSCRDTAVRGVSKVLALLVVIQFSLGALAVLTLRNPPLTSVHVLVGAILLALCVLFAARTYPANG